MTVQEAIGFLRRSAWVIVAATALGLLGAVAVAAISPPSYAARSQLMIGAASDANISDTQQAYDLARGQISSYAKVADSPLVLRPVIESLQLDTTPADLAERVDAEFEPGTVVIDLTVRADTPEEAERLAQAISTELTSTIEQLDRLPDDRPLLTAVNVNPAAADSGPAGVGLTTTLLFGALGGLIVGMLLAALRDGLRRH